MMILGRNGNYWIGWIVLSLVLTVFLLTELNGSNKDVFLPGATSSGHYQIEAACGVCHTDPFGGGEVLQDACMNCHEAELDLADDSHPKSKFTDPRNAARVAKLNARECVTCHVEHRPEITGPMAVTVPEDVCHLCHEDIAEDRPSHAGMAFTTCASAGCHNFHDNRALYEDFLVKHGNEPDVLSDPGLPPRDLRSALALVAEYPAERYPLHALALSEQDAPAGLRVDAKVLDDWDTTAHATAGVNCSACHGEADQWVDQVAYSVCGNCHRPETETFEAGKHGMRLAQDLSPMKPALARQPMRGQAHGKELNCATCHTPHRFDTATAAVDACLRCHADEHSLAYRDSEHYRLWLQEQQGIAAAGTGVSCASCHLPRIEHSQAGAERVLVQHNQNDTLRPNEKMLRPVCMRCHGLEFALDALADAALINNNFQGRPVKHIESIDMALLREEGKE